MDPMMHEEIYQSGYDDNNELWLRDWKPIPRYDIQYGCIC